MTTSSRNSYQSSTDFAYKSILKWILSGKVIGGQHLKYADLEKQLGISKTPIISALNQLEDKGIINYIKHRGYFVAEIDFKKQGEILVAEDYLDVGNLKTPAMNDIFSPISLQSVVYEKIKDMIRTLKVVPGQKLVYSDLEKKFGISKTPIINALSKLERDGYVHIKKNVGCYVKDIQPEVIAEVMEARSCLEISNVDFVMRELTNADLTLLEALQARYRSHNTTRFDNAKMTANADFHIHLAQMGRNRFMVKSIENIYEWIGLWVRLDLLPAERIIVSENEHDEMIEALHRRDADLLKLILQKHLTAAIQYYLPRHLN